MRPITVVTSLAALLSLWACKDRPSEEAPLTGQVASAVKECQSDADCSGGICDRGVDPWQCVTRHEIGDDCSTDQDCHGGVPGTQRICEGGICSDACRSDFDCQPSKGFTCDTKTSHRCAYNPQAACSGGGGAAGGAGKSGSAGAAGAVDCSCTIAYPSVTLKGVLTPAKVKQQYDGLGCGDRAPTCMLDRQNLKNAAGAKVQDGVHLSKKFTLSDLTWGAGSKARYVYVDPALVASLEKMSASYLLDLIHVKKGFVAPSEAKAGDKCPASVLGRAVDVQSECQLQTLACDPGGFGLIAAEGEGASKKTHLELPAPGQSGCRYVGGPCEVCEDPGETPDAPTAAQFAQLPTECGGPSYPLKKGGPAVAPICGNDGGFSWLADGDIDCDGVGQDASLYKNGAKNPCPDQSAQAKTSWGPVSNKVNVLKAHEVPYFVMPDRFHDYLGSVGVAVYQGQVVYGVFADSSGGDPPSATAKIGEMSLAMGRKFNASLSGGNNSVTDSRAITYALFSKCRVPLSKATDTAFVARLGARLARDLLAAKKPGFP